MAEKQQQPNFLLIMADFMGAKPMPLYGGNLVRIPNIEALAKDGVVFEKAYSNAPLCAPSRASMMTGKLPSKISVFDNGAELPSSIPTIAHYLRARGYATCLSGKMHFVGADQLHGFEERVTSDVVPADFGWMPFGPDTEPAWKDAALDEWPNMKPVIEAGVCIRSLGMDFDDEVAFQAVRKIHDYARDPDQKPFFLTASFIEPHEPYATTQAFWDRFDHHAIPAPTVPFIPYKNQDAHSRRLYDLSKVGEENVTDDHIRNSRHAYCGMVSNIDDKIGALRQALEETGLFDNTVIIITADHGGMLGERGLWGILNFYEWASRVPLIFHAPSHLSPRRVGDVVSLLELMPTMVELAGGDPKNDVVHPIDGVSLATLMAGGTESTPRTVAAEFCAEATESPCLMIRRGAYKYVYCADDPPLLFDLDQGPDERDNLAENPDYEKTLDDFHGEVMGQWHPETLKAEVSDSRRRRAFIFAAHTKGKGPAWDHVVDGDAAGRYQRSHVEPWQATEERAFMRHKRT
ncbi:MAG: choline-sulfatase [Alphaproteobacteria bacterium]